MDVDCVEKGIFMCAIARIGQVSRRWLIWNRYAIFFGIWIEIVNLFGDSDHVLNGRHNLRNP